MTNFAIHSPFRSCKDKAAKSEALRENLSLRPVHLSVLLFAFVIHRTTRRSPVHSALCSLPLALTSLRCAVPPPGASTGALPLHSDSRSSPLTGRPAGRPYWLSALSPLRLALSS